MFHTNGFVMDTLMLPELCQGIAVQRKNPAHRGRNVLQLCLALKGKRNFLPPSHKQPCQRPFF